MPQAREATTNRMQWELITDVSPARPARRTDGVLVLRSETRDRIRRLRASFRLYD